jgi:hypothetical protein
MREVNKDEDEDEDEDGGMTLEVSQLSGLRDARHFSDMQGLF